MEIQAIKLEITNSVNENKQIEWFFCNTEKEKKEFIDKKKSEQFQWNNDRQGVVSTRYYNFDEYLIDNLLECNMSELEGMKLSDFLSLIKNLI